MFLSFTLARRGFLGFQKYSVTFVTGSKTVPEKHFVRRACVRVLVYAFVYGTMREH